MAVEKAFCVLELRKMLCNDIFRALFEKSLLNSPFTIGTRNLTFELHMQSTEIYEDGRSGVSNSTSDYKKKIAETLEIIPYKLQLLQSL